MEQTGGLFHPLLSQRIYQSNQGLKLSAQAFWLPKGALICLKSCGLSNDSKVDMKQEELLSFWVRPISPFLPALVSIWLYLSCPSFRSDTSFNSGFQLTGPAKQQGPACPGQSASPHSGGGPWETRQAGCWQAVWGWRLGLMLLLLLSDRQSCLTLMAISVAEFPGPRLLLYSIAAGCHWTGPGAGVGWGSPPVILLLVSHVKLWLLRRLLQ